VEAEIFVGVILALFLGGYLVEPIFSGMTGPSKPTSPTNFNPDIWEQIIGRSDKNRAGKWLGILECLLFYVMIASTNYVAIAGWLAFKVAAKWEAWKNIVRFPDKIESEEKISELDFLRARTELGTWIMSKFLIGTMLNLFVGLISFGLSGLVVEVIWFLAEAT